MATPFTFLVTLALTPLVTSSSVDEGPQRPKYGSHEPNNGTPVPSPVFRLGSGAVVAPATTGPLQQSNKYHNIMNFNTLQYLLITGSVIITVLTLMQMMPGPRGQQGGLGGNSRDYQYRIPPAWSPENEHQYPFRSYMTDVSLWMVLTDLQPHQQCAAIVARLGGAARDLARMLTPQEIMHGGQLQPGGPVVDPVTYLLGSLHTRFSALEEESRMTTMTEFLAFARLPSEDINSMLARYETVRQRAAVEGQISMSVEFCALQIFRACNVAPQHLFTLLQPFDNQLPTTQEQLSAMCRTLRRHGHISEHMPGNIASALHGPARQARAGAYMAMDAPSMDLRSSQGTAAFLSDSQSGQAASQWDTLLPAALTSGNPFAAWSHDQQQSSQDQGYAPAASQYTAPNASYPVTADADNQDSDWIDETSSSATSSDDGEETLRQHTGPTHRP